ncbi:hypothetical protein V5F38_10355 [Xanthobacter sp. V0B-10]|uniref:hypothetical protein n=1 Tax=Xanthobacter albus TaxID=3119929 RepID=UPI00372B4C1A
MAYIRKIESEEPWRGVVKEFREEDLREIDARLNIKRIARYARFDGYGGAGIYADDGELVGVCWGRDGICIYIRPPLDRDSPELRDALEAWLGKTFLVPVAAFVDARSPHRLTSWAALGFVLPDGPPAPSGVSHLPFYRLIRHPKP